MFFYQQFVEISIILTLFNFLHFTINLFTKSKNILISLFCLKSYQAFYAHLNDEELSSIGIYRTKRLY